jgi:RNA recognition motif-containing protein
MESLSASPSRLSRLLGSSVAPFSSTQKALNGSRTFCRKDFLVGKKLYVGNLTDAVTHSDLKQWFTRFGTVQSAQVIHDREMGGSKGFGFVEMDTDSQAEAAIQGLNDHEHDGRRIVVSEAKPRVTQTTRLAGGSVDGGGRIGGGYWK